MQKIKLTFVLLFVISIVGCNVANKNIKQNIDNNKQSNGIIVDNNSIRFTKYLEDNLFQISLKIMEEEKNISDSKNYDDMLKAIINIKNYLTESFELIDRYEKRSKDTKYQKYISYVRCIYNNIKSSYLFMESVINSEKEIKYYNSIEKFKNKMRKDTSDLFLKSMGECEKLR